MSLLHLSDTHFGTEVPRVVLALERLVATLRPDLVLLSGDITQRATDEQFRRARDFLDRLPAPCRLLIPGNHDIPLFDPISRALVPYRRYRKGLGERDTDGVHDLVGLRVVRVKSTRRRRHVDGEISSQQVTRVAAALREAPSGSLRLVVTHHPLWVDRACDAHNVCRGAASALDAWRDAGADLLLAGHIHWPFVQRLPGPRPLWAVNAGTAVSARIRDGVPQSCNLLRWDPAQPRAGGSLVRFDYAQPLGAFAERDATTLAFD